MEKNSEMLSIIAYYLSEYDKRAVKALGYETVVEAFEKISAMAGRKESYIRLRRDEFDALPDSSSDRQGWHNRPPKKQVAELGAYLKPFSFEELTEIVRSLIRSFQGEEGNTPTITRSVEADVMSEEELEQIVNFSDPDAAIEVVTRETTRRVCNTAIIHSLKKLYKGQCQLCGRKPLEEFDADICEAHHIQFYSETQNNDADNIIILCPNHHRLIHQLKPVFDREAMEFKTARYRIPVILDYHLKEKKGHDST